MYITMLPAEMVDIQFDTCYAYFFPACCCLICRIAEVLGTCVATRSPPVRQGSSSSDCSAA